MPYSIDLCMRYYPPPSKNTADLTPEHISSDAPALSPYEMLGEAIAALREADILTKSLYMDDAVNRALFIRLIVGALGAELPEADASVPGETWYAPYVKAGYAIGLFGDSRKDMSFTPTDGFYMGKRGYEEMELPISRYDAAAIVSHALPAETDEANITFSEEDTKQTSAILQKHIKRAVKYIPLLDDGRFHGDNSLTCREAILCAWKLMTEDVPLSTVTEQQVPSAKEVLSDGRIVHAGGRISDKDGNDYTYTNSAEALVNAYRLGNRIMEFDFMHTPDGHLACIHKWESAVSPLITDGEALSLEEWLQVEVYNNFTPLCLESLVGFMREHPDFYIVTDVKDGNTDAAELIADACPDLIDRFIIQIYKDSEYTKINELGFNNIIYTMYNLSKAEKQDTAHWVTYAADHPLLGYTYQKSWRNVEGYTDKMKETGIMLFVHTINDKADIEACYSEGFTSVYTDNPE